MYTLLVTGDVPGAATYFNPLVQQSVIPCTSGTRPTPSHDGMTVYETDTDLHATWNGSAWIYAYSPAYTSYTPTFYSNGVAGTAISGGSVSVTYAAYQKVNKRVHCYGHATINTTTASGFAMSLPFAVGFRSFSLSSITLKGSAGYSTSFGDGHCPNTTGPFNRVTPVSSTSSNLNILTSGDTVHWNVTYESV